MRAFVMAPSSICCGDHLGRLRRDACKVEPARLLRGRRLPEQPLQFTGSRITARTPAALSTPGLLRGSTRDGASAQCGDQIRATARRLRPWLCRCRARSSRADLRRRPVRHPAHPDGRDDWSFEPRLMLTFSDRTSRTYAWPQVMLDNAHPEVTLSLSSAVAESVKRRDL